MKILYAVMWNKKNPETTWSGTGYSLFKALSKHNEVELIDTMPSKFKKIITSFAQMRYKKYRIYREKYVYNKLLISLQENSLNRITKKMKDSKTPMISIARNYSRNYPNQYLYMDLNPTCMIYIRNNRPELKQYLPFSETTDDVMKWQEKFQLQSYKNCKCLFTMSEWVRELTIKNTNIDPNNIFTVGAGINLDVSKIDNKKKSGNKILFIGKEFYRKGGDLVVKAFEKLIKEMPTAELYIVGPLYKPKEITDDLQGIHFLGQLSFDEVSLYFNKCDIFCMPSRFEAYGIVYIEALVYGLPCIANDDFAMKEIIQEGENGYLISNENVEMLKTRMIDLLKNETIKKKVLYNRPLYIEQYSWEKVADKMSKIITEKEKK